MRILVVEDNDRVGAFLEQGLRDERFEVDRVSDGMTAVTKVESADYDLILLDHRLPGTSGAEIAVQLRAAGRHIPILMLTARSVPEDFRFGRTAGINDFLSKPFRFDDLLNRIRALVPGIV